MPDFILNFDYIVYIIWAIVWVVISSINTSIYKEYNNTAVEAFGNAAPNLEGNLLTFFTFRWSIDLDETEKITRLKKALNKTSILFVTLTIICATLVIYKLNHKAI